MAVSVTAVMGFVRGIWRRKDHVGLMRESVLRQRAAEQMICLVCHQRWQTYSGVCFLVVSLSLTLDWIVLSGLTISQCPNHLTDFDQPNFRACSCLMPSPLPFLGTSVGGWPLLRCPLTQQIQASRETRPSACFGDASRNAKNSQRSSLL